MEWLFGHRMTPEEMLRKNQRALNKAMRDLDRERLKMEQQEKKVIADIKKLAKDGQMDAVKIMAKDLVRTRRYVRKFMLMKANIQAVALKIQTLKSQSSMAQAMRGVTRAMASMNRQLNVPQIQKILQEFEKQSEIMDMKEEMMNDSIDEAMEGDDDEEERFYEFSNLFLFSVHIMCFMTYMCVQRRGGVSDPGRTGTTAQRSIVGSSASDGLALCYRQEPCGGSGGGWWRRRGGRGGRGGRRTQRRRRGAAGASRQPAQGVAPHHRQSHGFLSTNKSPRAVTMVRHRYKAYDNTEHWPFIFIIIYPQIYFIFLAETNCLINDF